VSPRYPCQVCGRPVTFLSRGPHSARRTKADAQHDLCGACFRAELDRRRPRPSHFTQGNLIYEAPFYEEMNLT